MSTDAATLASQKTGPKPELMHKPQTQPALIC